ncbi:MAG TPA: hypothetical protein VFE06_00375 [Acidobacteriaceae bacterium]|jgi:hypothetical protein|nr:hypothetical protein [Acidobacteriaceae bacterium]
MATSKIRRAFQTGLAAMKAHRAAGPTEIVVPAKAAPEPRPEITPPVKAAPTPPLTIRTSEKDWLARLTEAYRQHAQVELIDDAGAGIDPARQSLLQMGLSGRLSRREWTAVSVSGGMTVFGAGLIVAAILDPDPTSKLGLLVGSGALLALTGGFQTIHLLTRLRPPSITISPRGIHIDWHGESR